MENRACNVVQGVRPAKLMRDRMNVEAKGPAGHVKSEMKSELFGNGRESREEVGAQRKRKVSFLAMAETMEKAEKEKVGENEKLFVLLLFVCVF